MLVERATASAPAAAVPTLTTKRLVRLSTGKTTTLRVIPLLISASMAVARSRIAGKLRLQCQHHHNAEKVENSLVQEDPDDHPHQAEERRRVTHIHGADSHGKCALEAIQNHPVERLVNLPGRWGLSECVSKEAYTLRTDDGLSDLSTDR